MSRYEKPERRFSPGDIVLHRQWGAGQVLEEVKEGAQESIAIGFPGKPYHLMSLEVADRALSQLPSNGLEALLLRTPDMARQWSRRAPLKLIATTLTDLGGDAKSGDLRRKLERPNVLHVKWQSWWKRVQPVIHQSPHFRTRSDGAYQLISAVADVPESPLASSPRKGRITSLDGAQVAAVASRLETGDVGFESLKDANSLRLIAKELVQRSATSEKAQAVIDAAMTGSVLQARLVLEELSCSATQVRMADAMIGFITSIQHSAASSKKGKKIGAHVLAKTGLLEQTIRDYVAEHDICVWGPQVQLFTRAALQLGMAIWEKGMTYWRSESLEHVSKVVAVLGEKHPMVFEFAGDYLASKDEDLASALAVADTLLAKAAPEVHSDAIDRFLQGALTGSSRFVEHCFLRHLAAGQRSIWISSALSRILSSVDTHSLTMLATLLGRSMPDLESRELKACAELAIRIASVSHDPQASLLLAIQESLTKSLGALSLEGREVTIEAGGGTVLGAIEVAFRDNLRKTKDEAERRHDVLEAEIANTRRALLVAEAESVRRKELIEQLKSGYRLPERWAAFEGSRRVLQAIVDIHQEAFLVQKTGSAESESITWVLRLLESVLQGSGVATRGRAGTTEVYDPALHDYIPGSKREGTLVRIVCPAFEWQDPAGKKMLLARGKVVGC